MIGRESELELLQDALEAARRREQRFVEIVGEPGIGKSRLVEELSVLGRGFHQYAARCRRSDASDAYAPIRGLLRAVVGIPPEASSAAATPMLQTWLRTTMPDLEGMLPLLALPFGADTPAGLEGDSSDPARQRQRMYDGIDALLTRTLMMPTLLVFEDAQWMDDASRSLLGHIAQSSLARPWLVCVTRRPRGAAVAAEETRLTIQLAPLPPAAAARVAVRAAEGAALHPHLLDALVARSGGNPLFLRELAGAFESGLAATELPATIEALIGERIAELGPDDRIVLTHAAVIGSEFDVALLAETLPLGSGGLLNEQRWSRLSGFVVAAPDEPQRFRFVHDLFQEVAYRRLDAQLRRDFHARLAAVLEQRAGDAVEGHATALAFHFGEAGDHEKTWRYALLAARDAQTRYANVVAAGLYERAVAAAGELPDVDAQEVALALESLGDVRKLFADYRKAAEAYERAEALVATDDVKRARLVGKRGKLHESGGRYDEAIQCYEQALELIPAAGNDVQRNEQAELIVSYAGALFRKGRFEEAAERAGAVTDLLADGGDQRTLAHAYYVLEISRANMGEPPVGDSERALAIYEEVGDFAGQAVVLNNLAVVAHFEGRWGDAIGLYTRARVASERAGDVAWTAIIANNTAEILSDQGKLAAAGSLFKESRSTLAGAEYATGAALATQNLGRTAAREGRHAEAQRMLTDALDAFERMGAAAFVVETKARLAEAFVLEGEHRKAYDVATAALQMATGGEQRRDVVALLERIAGYAALQNFERDLARSHFQRSLEHGQAHHAPYEIALTLRALAELAERTGEGDAAALHAESREMLDALGVVWTPPIVLPDAGEL